MDPLFHLYLISLKLLRSFSLYAQILGRDGHGQKMHFVLPDIVFFLASVRVRSHHLDFLQRNALKRRGEGRERPMF
jgi:hypothetical protein